MMSIYVVYLMDKIKKNSFLDGQDDVNFCSPYGYPMGF